MANVSGLDRLKSQLLTSGLQQKDQPLYQVINQLIDFVRQGFNETQATFDDITGGSSGLPNQTILTVKNELSSLPFSRQLVAGTGIQFNDTLTKLIISGAAIPGMSGEVGEEGLMGVPGPIGITGLTGPTGPSGSGSNNGEFYWGSEEEYHELPALFTLTNQLSIPETAIIDGTLLARVAADETISGTWTFTAGRTIFQGSPGRIDIINTAAAANERVYRLTGSGGSLVLQAVDDAFAVFNNFLTFARTASAPNTMNMPYSLLLSGSQTVTLSADQTAWNPTGLGSKFYYDVSTSAAGWFVRGILAQAVGTIIVLFNNSSGAFSITNEDGAASAANRFTLPGAATISITSAGAVTLYYDGVRWRLIGKTI